ncbi:MAG: hypothetical protein KF729_05550 [Sandaracinaceae bacterium]|nr:hypothetical protein [Sandaracinaceae bacterium]
MVAKCGTHPDRDADGGTCARCGTFVCAECVAPGGAAPVCTSCLAHLDRGPHVRHLRILAILFMVHGGLLLAAGVSYLLFGGLMLDELARMPADPGSPESEVLPELVGVFAAAMGLGQLAPGVVQAFAGWQLFRYRGLGLAWAAAIGGLFAVLGCYCAPTALLLGGYAAYVLSRPDVRARLALGVPPASHGA